MTVQTLAIAGLELTPKVQVRDALDAETIRRYAEQENLPPISVVLIQGDHVVADGWHRVRAAKKRGDERVWAHICDSAWPRRMWGVLRFVPQDGLGPNSLNLLILWRFHVGIDWRSEKPQS